MTCSARTLTAVTLALVLGASAGAQQTRAPVDPATAATIRRLLDLTGAANTAVRSMEAMMPAQRAANPQIPAAFWDAFLAHARREIPQLVDTLIPIYASHFTRPEGSTTALSAGIWRKSSQPSPRRASRRGNAGAW